MDNPVSDRPTFVELSKIEKKIEALWNVLSPVLYVRPTDVEKEVNEPSTEVLKRLNRIDRSLKDLLDSIVL